MKDAEMAVIQAVFKHCEIGTQEIVPPDLPGKDRNRDFSYQVRSLVQPEAHIWEDGDEVVLNWGDPAQCLAPSVLAAACRHGTARAMFGRSWIHYHRSQHRLTLGADIQGLYPILINQSASATYVASDALALSQLLGDFAQKAPLALLDLLAYGHLLGEQSTLENTRHLQGGTVCVINHVGNPHNYHDHPFYPPQTTGHESHAIDSLVAVMDKYLQQEPGALLPLSGGTDSRLLLAAAQAGGHRPVTCCFAPPDSMDYEIAATLATVAGVEFRDAGTGSRQFSALQNNIALLGGGEVPMLRGCGLLSPELVTRTRGAVLLTTTGASLLRGAYHESAALRGAVSGTPGFRKLSLKNACRHAEAQFDEYLTPFIQAWPALEIPLRDRLQRRLAIYRPKACDGGHYLDTVYLGEQVRRREIATQQLFARDYARTHPFLYPEVMNSFAALSLSQRLKGCFQRRAISKLSPRLAEVCWNKTMRPMAESVRQENSYFCWASYWGITHIAQHGQPLCDSDMRSWLNARAAQTGALCELLRTLDIPESDIAAGMPVFMNASSRWHTLSALAVYEVWSDYLDKRCNAAVLAA
jgi:asparagine synthase (glutamine-hydrolysing)